LIGGLFEEILRCRSNLGSVDRSSGVIGLHETREDDPLDERGRVGIEHVIIDNCREDKTRSPAGP
jgi:hypothetical protein